MGNLLLNMDTLARRMVAMFFAFVSCREIAAVFSLPTEEEQAKENVPGMQFEPWDSPDLPKPVLYRSGWFDDIRERLVGGVTREKLAILCGSNPAKTALAKVLAGLHPRLRVSSGTTR